jgi:superfamily II DNA or RNA helicase
LANILADHHYPERTLIFTNDNADGISHFPGLSSFPPSPTRRPLKERHQVPGVGSAVATIPTLVVSHVLNEGVDVPDARVAVLLSGTGSTREYIQRLGRILRKGSGHKASAALRGDCGGNQ